MSSLVNLTNTLAKETFQLRFGWTDYTLFGVLLGVSLLIGIYFGTCSKQDSKQEYLYGGKSMAYIPVAISILASLLSGITFLGIPTEVYFHGANVLICLIPAFMSCAVTAHVFIPILCDLQVSSSYEYLELRFSKTIRSLASFFYVVSLLMYIPIVVYVPSLAFSQVTGYGVHYISVAFSIVCITYTTMGGVKAVVWTDFIQFMFTLVGVLAIIIIGLNTVGGLPEVWKRAVEGKRLDIFDFDPNLTSRNTVWGMSFGIFFLYLSRFTVGQKFIQRFLSIEKETDIKKAIFLQGAGWIALSVCCILTGLLVYARYHGCDPLTAKLIERHDQTIPYYVMDVAGHVHGLPGLFLAGLVSSALSTMSASLNTTSGIIYEDFVDRWVPESPNKDVKSANIMKVISVIIGFVVIALIFIIEHLGTIFEMASSLSSIVDGPLLGLFILGLFVPWAGKKGAITGCFVTIGIMAWILIGIQWHTFKKHLPNPTLPISVENCPYPLNETVKNISDPHPSSDYEKPMILYRISFLYLIMIGTFLTVITGLITSLILGETDLAKVNPRHIVPLFRRFLPEKQYVEVPLKEISQQKFKH